MALTKKVKDKLDSIKGKRLSIFEDKRNGRS